MLYVFFSSTLKRYMILRSTDIRFQNIIILMSSTKTSRQVSLTSALFLSLVGTCSNLILLRDYKLFHITLKTFSKCISKWAECFFFFESRRCHESSFAVRFFFLLEQIAAVAALCLSLFSLKLMALLWSGGFFFRVYLRLHKKPPVCAAGTHHIRAYGTQETDAISFGCKVSRHSTTFAPWGFVDTWEVLYFLLLSPILNIAPKHSTNGRGVERGCFSWPLGPLRTLHLALG